MFRSVPFSAAILMALFALCGFSAFLFVTTQHVQDVRGMSALTAGATLTGPRLVWRPASSTAHPGRLGRENGEWTGRVRQPDGTFVCIRRTDLRRTEAT